MTILKQTVDVQSSRQKVRKKSLLREYAESIALALIIALFVRSFIVQSFKIPSGSMEDTLLVGDYIIVNKFIYGVKIPFSGRKVIGIRNPKRGDIVVFQYPHDISKDFIKRVIGTPGDEIEIRDKKVYVNGKLYESLHEIYKDRDQLPDRQNQRDNFGPVRVPNDSYFVMGDNRDRSYDSRFWGFVKTEHIKGLALVKYWSWDKDHSKVRWGNIGRLIE